MRKLMVMCCVLVLSLTGCASRSGFGTGHLRQHADARAEIAWESRDSVSGSLRVALQDGRVFSGTYFQITRESRIDRLDPLWAGWHPAWRGWPHWYREPGPEFVRHYTGRVLANLKAENDEYMRCRIRLVHPRSGLSGGGEGTCQLPDGGVLDVTIPGD